MYLKGRLFTGLSSGEHEAALVVDETGVRFESPTVALPETYALDQLRIQSRLGSIPRVIETPDHRRFETEDFAGVEELERKIGKKSFVHRFESEWRVAIPIAISLLIGIVLFYKVVIPTYSRALAPFVPMKVRREISRPFEVYLEKIHGLKTDLTPEEQKRFDDAVAELKKDEPITTVDLLDVEPPNAFILPDDHVYVTRGLAKLAASSDEILAVLLHESGHRFFAHAMQSFIESSSLSVGLVLITGGTEWSNIPIVLLQNSYSRQAETEADLYAIQRLRQLKKDPAVFADIFERLQQKTEGLAQMPAFLSTHPSFDERIKRIRDVKAK